MSHASPRPGTHAWDERDAGSIASHTPSHRYLGAQHLAGIEAEPLPVRRGFCATARLASAMMARVRAQAVLVSRMRTGGNAASLRD